MAEAVTITGNGFAHGQSAALSVKPQAIACRGLNMRTNGRGSFSESHPSLTRRASREPFSLFA